LSGQFSPLTAPFRSMTHPLLAPLPLHRFITRPLTALLPLTQFTARSAQFFGPIPLRSHALVCLHKNGQHLSK